MMRFAVEGLSGWGTLLAGWLAIGGCSVLPPAQHEPVRTFLLAGTASGEEVRPVEPSSALSPEARTVLIAVPQARPGFETARMIYVSREYELRSFALHRWVDTPARMLHSLVVQALEETGAWRVTQPPSPVRGDYRLEIHDLLLQHEFLHDPSRVRFRARAQLVDLNGPRLRGTREFIVVEDAPSDDPYGGVLAANRAVRIFLQELREWLRGCTADARAMGC